MGILKDFDIRGISKDSNEGFRQVGFTALETLVLAILNSLERQIFAKHSF